MMPLIELVGVMGQSDYTRDGHLAREWRPGKRHPRVRLTPYWKLAEEAS